MADKMPKTIMLLGLLALTSLAASIEAKGHFDAATTEFAAKLYQEIAKTTDDSKNIFFSPLSIFTAFGMLKAGARGKTEKQMEQVMNWDQLKSEEGHSGIQNLLRDVFAPLSAENTISVANKVWMQKYFCLETCQKFVKVLEDKYSAALEELNFAGKPEDSRKAINKWIEDKTNRKIKDLMPPGSVLSDTRFVLTNAIYFKSKWKSQFNKNNTADRSFHALGKNGVVKKQVPVMYQNGRFFSSGFMPTAPYQLLEMPYENSELSMVVILPRSAQEMKKIETTNQPLRLYENIMEELYEFPETGLDVFLPKFKIASDLKLKNYLINMGMKDVFSQRKADLSGITGFRGLHVNAAVHKAYVNVDEEGTEAAAATGIGITLTSLPFQFKVDKPFFFMIKHKKSGVILFMGRVMDPTAE